MTLDATSLEQLRAQIGCVALGLVASTRGGLAACAASSVDDQALLERAAVCGPLVLGSLGSLDAPAPLGTPPGSDGVEVLVLSGDARRVAVIGTRKLQLVALLAPGDSTEALSKLKRAVFRSAQELAQTSGIRNAVSGRGGSR